MLGRQIVGSGAGRLALLALVPVLLGAGLWLTNDDGRSPATTRVEATQSTLAPLLGQAVAGPWESSAPATPAPAVGVADGGETLTATVAAPASPAQAGTTGASSDSGTPAPSPAPATAAGIGRSDATDGGVDGGAGGEPAPARSTGTGTGTGPATSSADSSTGASSAPSAPTGDASPTTTEPTTTSAPTTQATTTTTAPAPAPLRSASRSRIPSAEAEVVPLTNQDRAAAGLGALSRNACLDSAASGFAEQMARSGVLAHNSGAAAAVAGCRPNPTWGDNVGTATPCDTAMLEEKWMASPSHRRNILTGAFTLIGVGAWTDDKGACWVQVLFSS